jgi:filamentous hemagglutinin
MSAIDPERIEIDPRKLRDYLLNEEHPEGGPKARFLLALGFERSDPWVLAGELREVAANGTPAPPVESPYGSKVIVDGTLRGASIRTVWIVDRQGGPFRFITAYPRKSDR